MSLNTKVSVMAIYFGLLMLALNETSITALSLRGTENDEEQVKANNEALECNPNFVVEITRGPTSTLPSGTPVFTVQILNQCPTDCRIAQLHLKCGSFTSEKPIPSNIFKRVGDDDCLVNDGLPIGIGSGVSFEYAHPQMFYLPVSSLQCLP